MLLSFVVASTGCEDDDDVVGDLTIAGVVTGDGGPLEGATVTDGDDENNTTTTDANGAFSIMIADGGSLVVTAQGFETETISNINAATVVTPDLDIRDFPEYFTTAGNRVLDPAFAANSIQPTASLGNMSDEDNDGFFQDVDFIGAVSPSGTPWYAGWSFYDNLVNGQTNSDALTVPTNEITITDADLAAAGTTVNWTNDNTYILDGFVFVNNGQTLNIQEGTIIQAKAGEAANASALIVARGGTLNAEGTAAEPIIFTYEGDTGNSAATLRGQWGGLIVLGNAGLNSAPGESAIEGIPTGEARGLYGVGSGFAQDDADNSGILRYVSIRHGGTLIGGDNEINGLTLGGVGSGTTIEYVEVIGNRDDGIEWFGGTANGKWLISAFCGDDGIDYDEGYRGKNQFVVVHQDPADADRGGEFDGGTDPETATPFAIPTFFNMTFIGNDGSRAITLRDNAGGRFYNSIFSGFGRGVDIENLEQDQDSYKQFLDGNLIFENNVFHNIGAGDARTDLFVIIDVED